MPQSNCQRTTPNRREILRLATAFWATVATGCVPQSQSALEPDLVWGKLGISEGRFQKARALVLSPEQELYIVDKMGRIQVFDLDGVYRRGWTTPAIAQGKPTGLGWSNDGLLMVADTHYFRVLFYSPEGHLDEERTIGGEFGDRPGQFHFVTDVAQDPRGHYLVGQYGQVDRIQEFDPSGELIRLWGTQGSKPGQFSRPQCLLVDREGLLWVADACNHRIQVFDISGPEPILDRIWGQQGTLPGQMHTPYGIEFDSDNTVLVCEYGNHRIQRFSQDGRPLEVWGGHGKEPGKLLHPWGLALDSRRRLHVLDTENFRIQRFVL